MSGAWLSLLLSCSVSADPAATDTGAGTDCPSPSTWYVDGDGDGFGAGAATGQGCERPQGHVANADDCNDADASVNPHADEVCNGIDDDCDGAVDPPSSEGVITCWQDADGDGYGDADVEALACACSDGWVLDDTDCDDTDVSAHPGADEVLYDGIDQDCLGMDGEYDRDGDGYDWVGGEGVAGTDCDDDDSEIHPDAYDVCEDEIDQDCDGRIDECGFEPVTGADHAWVRIYRDNEKGPNGIFGDSLVHAGDSDGDGNLELVGQVLSYPGTGAIEYRLIEVPQRTGGGDVELDEVTVATWQVPQDDLENWTESGWRYDEGIIAKHDLDGDGSRDYLFLSNGSPTGGPSYGLQPVGRLDLWTGPAEGVMSMDDAMTVEYPSSGGVRFWETMEFLPASSPSDEWSIAVHLWPNSESDEGTEHPGIVMIQQDHLEGVKSVSDGATIWTSAPYEPSVKLEAGDLDGDGVADLLSSSQRYRTDLPPGQVYLYQGPLDGDRSMDDADLVIEGAEDGDYFGNAIAICADTDSDGLPELAVTNPYAGALPASVFFYEPHVAAWPTSMPAEGAFARIDGDEESPPPEYAPRMVGDPDADGIEELAVPTLGYFGDPTPKFGIRVLLFEPPAEGVVTFADADARLTGDEDIDPYAGFGVSLLGGVDYDGDTWSDLVVGEYFWDADPAEFFSPYGRLLIFRGEIGAE